MASLPSYTHTHTSFHPEIRGDFWTFLTFYISLKENLTNFLYNHLMINKGAMVQWHSKTTFLLRGAYLIHLDLFVYTLNLQKTVETMESSPTLNSSGKTDEMIILSPDRITESIKQKVVKNLHCTAYWRTFMGFNTQCIPHSAHLFKCYCWLLKCKGGHVWVVEDAFASTEGFIFLKSALSYLCAFLH